MGGVDSVFNMTSACCNASSELLGPHILQWGVWLIYESYSGQAIRALFSLKLQEEAPLEMP